MIVPASDVHPSLWPPILHRLHEDWPWPFSYTPRWKTAYFGPPPRKIEGNAVEHDFWYVQIGEHVWRRCESTDEGAELFRHPLPIPEPGQWWRGEPDFYASKSASGWYTRRGYRWDDLDGYYNYPSFTIKKW